MQTGDAVCRAGGRGLLRRIIEEYPGAWTEVAFAHEAPGNAYTAEGRFDEAEQQYRHCLALYSRSRSGGSGLCDLRLAELIVHAAQRDKYPEAEALVETASHHLHLNSDRYRHAVAGARLAKRLGRDEEAAAYAEAALSLATVREPEFPRHPTVELVETAPDELEEMRTLTKELRAPTCGGTAHC
jgi:tetratricopeptide (TPR) repeat protein